MNTPFSQPSLMHFLNHRIEYWQEYIIIEPRQDDEPLISNLASAVNNYLGEGEDAPLFELPIVVWWSDDRSRALIVPCQLYNDGSEHSIERDAHCIHLIHRNLARKSAA